LLIAEAMFLPLFALAQGNAFSATITNTSVQFIGGAVVAVCNQADTFSNGACPVADANILSDPALSVSIPDPTYSEGLGNYTVSSRWVSSLRLVPAKESAQTRNNSEARTAE